MQTTRAPTTRARTTRAPTTPAKTTPADAASPALVRCVGDVDRFLERHWSQRPLLRAGADDSGFADLFSIDGIDALISSLPRLPEFRLVRAGKPLDPARYTRTSAVGGKRVPGVGDPGRIYEEFRKGATIVLQSLQRTWPPVARFCRSLELDLTHPVQANAYVTPPGERGLGVHHDTHDVFVLHLAGRKQWQVFEPVIDHPLPGQSWSAAAASTPLLLDVELEPGDCLYLPRGFPHSAWSGEAMAAHLTIGLLAFTAQDVVSEIVRRTADDVALRRSLPGRFADDERFADEVAAIVGELQRWLAALDTAAVAEAVSSRFWSTRLPLLAGQLRQLGLLDDLGDSATVRRRAGSVCRLSVGGDTLVAVLGDRRLDMPAALEPVVRHLAGGDPVRLGDLDDEIDEKSRLVLVRRLVREGLLELVE